MIAVVLELGCERIVYEADDWREALAIARNLLGMQGELRAGWKLTVEEEGGLRIGDEVRISRI